MDIYESEMSEAQVKIYDYLAEKLHNDENYFERQIWATEEEVEENEFTNEQVTAICRMLIFSKDLSKLAV